MPVRSYDTLILVRFSTLILELPNIILIPNILPSKHANARKGREKLCITFATKNLRSENPFFTVAQKTVFTRSKKKHVNEFKCRTSRYEKSSLPYMAKLLNKTN